MAQRIPFLDNAWHDNNKDELIPDKYDIPHQFFSCTFLCAPQHASSWHSLSAGSWSPDSGWHVPSSVCTAGSLTVVPPVHWAEDAPFLLLVLAVDLDHPNQDLISPCYVHDLSRYSKVHRDHSPVNRNKLPVIYSTFFLSALAWLEKSTIDLTRSGWTQNTANVRMCPLQPRSGAVVRTHLSGMRERSTKDPSYI